MAEVGLDSFVQTFRLGAELSSSDLFPTGGPRDTTDTFTELRALAQLGLHVEGSSHRLALRPRLSLGTDLQRGSLGIEYRWAAPAVARRFLLTLDLEGRRFSRESDFTLSSDTFQSGLRAHWRQRLTPSVDVGVRGRGYLTRYRTPSIYEYDEDRGDLAATLAVRRSWDFSFDFELGAGGRVAPDTTAISYERAFTAGTLSWAVGDRWRTDLYLASERRVYEDRTVRSPYWDLLLEPRLAWDVTSLWRLTVDAAMEWLAYDTSSEVYFDLWTGRVGLLARRSLGAVELGLEPRWSWLVSPEPVEDRFGQPGLVFRLDWFGTGRFWVSLTEEIGWRNYTERAGESDLDLYSDYWFLRTTFLGSVAMARSVSLDVFLSDEPETHRRADDDARLTLVTVSLRWAY